MAEYGSETPFPGDYHPGQVEASPGFLHAFEPSSALPHFSPATSEHSFSTPGGAANLDQTSRPHTGSGNPAATSSGEFGMSSGGQGQPPPGSAHGRYPGHHHTPSAQSGHSHSFSSASLPSLASSSTGFSITSHPEPHHGMYVGPGFTPNAEYTASPQQMLPPDGSKGMLGAGIPPSPHPGMGLPPNVGLGMGGIGMPPTPFQGTLPPALIARSPAGPSSAVMPSQAFPPGMGRMPHERHRSVSRPSPYHVQSSRSNSLSLKSEDEELMSIYSSASNASYPASWSSATGGIAGDIGQMSLEHRRSNSTPFEVPMLAQPIPGRSRARSFSLGKSSNSLEFLESDLEFTGPAAERETSIRADLATKAEQVRALSPCQHGKARAVWAKRWLKLSYTPVNGFTVPRQGLYHSYTMSCNDFGLRPINSASFGKVVRSTFLGIRTRRLGVRGNSKYHYVSLRPAISTEAHRLNAYGDSSGQLHIAPQDGDFRMDDPHSGQDILTEDDTEEEDDEDLADLSESMAYSAHPFPRGLAGGPEGRSRSQSQDEPLVIRSARPAYVRGEATPPSGVSSGASTAVGMSSPGAPRPAPPFPTLSAGVDPAIAAFWQNFCANQEQLGRAVTDLAFDHFEQNYRNFWESQTPETLHLCAQAPLSTMLVDGMAMSYDHIVLSLVDKILSPIPSNAHGALGMLALNFEKMTADALGGLATEVARPIVELSQQVAQLLSRFIDLQQITTAVGPILADPEQLAAMRTSWRMLDTNFIVRQSVLACDCPETIVEPALGSFGTWLNEAGMHMGTHPVEQLAGCIDGALARAEAGLGGNNVRTLIPKASFITSQVMRLLTLRSDMSFGWFQLIKTWIDDYVTISCARRAAFAVSESGGSRQSLPTFSLNIAGGGGGGGHHNPPLAIDTVSAHYNTVPALDQNAITPRPAFTSQGASTQASGPGVGGIAGAAASGAGHGQGVGVAGIAGTAGGPSFM